MSLAAFAIDIETVSRSMRMLDGDAGSAAICWLVMLGIFVVCRLPRPVIGACVLVAAFTVGLSSTMVCHETSGRAMASLARPAHAFALVD